MVSFQPSVSFARRRGPTSQLLDQPGSGGADAATLGGLVRSNVLAVAARPSDAAAVFLQILGSSRSQWPAAGTTANRGPWATGTSVAAFCGRQGRTATGQLREWVIFNNATNRRGTPYAGFVVQGIGAGPVRAQANTDAVRRTWNANLPAILRQAAEIARRRSNR